MSDARLSSYFLDHFLDQRAQLLRLVVLCIGITATPLVGLETEVTAQTRPRSSPPATGESIDYSQFSHATKKHQNACNTCHKVPTENWRDVRQFPDVADYPGHEACVSCHRAQFFRGARPPICTVCHTQAAPRADTRFAFPKQGTRLQFLTEFPHDKHQDVIARSLHYKSNPGIFARVSFRTQQPIEKYNNCTICHEARAEIVGPATAQWPDGFMPDALTFKSVPMNHSSCFNCHWKAQKPINQQCDGCHKLAVSPITRDGLANRISLKFKHDGGGERRNHVAECTTCHINITKSATVKGLKPDVPITSCTECHNKDGLRLDVSRELAQLDKNREFVCVYCHTSNVGRQDPPSGHYVIAGREPLKRKDLK
jgi:Outer membrane cytochrome MtrC/MtrF-like, domains II/IV